MSELVITAKCPSCNGENLREVCRVTEAQHITEWILKDGAPVPFDYGDIQTYAECSDHECYDCIDCSEEFTRPDVYLDGVKMEPGGCRS